MSIPSIIIGVDLSGPSNPADTACAVCEAEGAALRVKDLFCGLSDRELLSVVSRYAGEDVTIGLDAPLSYEDGGGDRSRDRELRTLLSSRGLPSGSVMTPTMTRMAYLTLRGVHLAAALARSHPDARILEVHPFGSLVLAGVDPTLAASVKRCEESRKRLLNTLPAIGLRHVPTMAGTDHELAALGAAHAAWRWRTGTPSWNVPSEPPHHPYPMAC
jgi:predicted nuclease with RNAse H fold